MRGWTSWHLQPLKLGVCGRGPEDFEVVSSPRVSTGPAGCRISLSRDYARRGWATKTSHPNWVGGGTRSGSKAHVVMPINFSFFFTTLQLSSFLRLFNFRRKLNFRTSPESNPETKVIFTTQELHTSSTRPLFTTQSVCLTPRT